MRTFRCAVVAAVLGFAGCGGDDAPADASGVDGGPTTRRDGGGPLRDGGGPLPAGNDCSDPHASWLFCEDFEAGGGDFAAWFSASDFLVAVAEDNRSRLTLSNDMPHDGTWAVHYPAGSASFEGASLDWMACDGAQETNCSMRSFDQLYFRVFVRFAPDHEYVHHFLSIGGSQPDDFWPHGSAGCLPNGALEMGTTVDHREGSHESFFYTYHPEMACDTACERYADVASICAGCADRGLPTCDVTPQCCWGENVEPDPPVAFPVGRWFCFEMTMQANTPGEHDGSMAYWIDGELGHEASGFMFRTSPTLALNRVRLQHYVAAGDADQPNQVWFDDVVVSTERIGCESF